MARSRCTRSHAALSRGPSGSPKSSGGRGRWSVHGTTATGVSGFPLFGRRSVKARLPTTAPSYRVRMEPEATEKRMRLRYAGICSQCGIDLPAKTEAIYDRAAKTVRCVTHNMTTPEPAVEVVDAGTPGGSARREYERRKAKREERVRARHPKLGGFILAVTDDQQSTKAWDVGAIGEERLGARLNELASDTLLPLHDRRIPGTRANIDHIVVATTGVYVIDAKKYKGRPQLRVEGGILRPRTEKLLVGSRDCTKLVEGVLKQVGIVSDLLTDDIPVHGVLCFVEADWPLIGGAFTTRGVQALWPKKLYGALRAPGLLDQPQLDEIHRLLASALPAA